jgi:hypothetical protein
MKDEAQPYRAYLVRLWQARSGRQVVWRASAEDAHSGERHAFADLQALCAFLLEETGGLSGREARAGEPPGPAPTQT